MKTTSVDAHINVDEKLEEVWNRINSGENIKEENHTVKNTLFPAWTKIAAAIAVLIGFG